jgi:glycosyltransferase involved in cell wall biosynthesis
VIERFKAKMGSELNSDPICHHAWQPHDGPRVGRARNMGIAMATGDYIVQIDGDMVLHPAFIADHRRAARPGHWVQGTRILLNETRTRDLIANGPRIFNAFSPGIGCKRRAYAFRCTAVSTMFRRAANAFVAIKAATRPSGARLRARERL